MKIGVSGHRWRDGADWDWVRARIDEYVTRTRIGAGYTSLAPGADQIFASSALDHGKRLVAVIPVCRGRIELEDTDKPSFDRFCERAKKIIRVKGETPDDAFLKSGKRVVNLVDRMIFVWDGAPSRGLGGTADIVAYAEKKRKAGVILDPIACTMRRLDQSEG
ncbi:MAG: hypothetical protein AAB227_12500 [Pseudomonadota bacterium]